MTIEYIAAGNRFKIWFDKEKIYFWFSLNSIKTIKKEENKK